MNRAKKRARVLDAESQRLQEDANREKNWKRWGPYLAERQWGTVREDYSEDGNSWEYFPHDHARSRAYRWGEDGLLGFTDREERLCFALALWNGHDPILKERIFGLTNPEGNHGEDVKDYYFYLDSTPTHSYVKGLYKYPQQEFPYSRLVEENRRRGKDQPEFELADTGIFDDNRYFDVTAEYAKASPNDILIKITVANRGLAAATLYLLPTLWFRNTWSWGRTGEGYWPKPTMRLLEGGSVTTEHESLGRMHFFAQGGPEFLFTENETNCQRLFGVASQGPYVKDAFHEYVIRGRVDAVNPALVGTKVSPYYKLEVPALGETVVRLRLTQSLPQHPFEAEFDRTVAARISEADDFYASRIPRRLDAHQRSTMRQAYAGLLWSKQFYHFSVDHWLEGDPGQPAAPERRKSGRNHDWPHLYNRDVISVPDKWEYPWYAAWDLACHMIPMVRVDPQFAKDQIVLFLREWYMHPNGQIPAYEFLFSDVSPPLHAWAAWRVYKISGQRGKRDTHFLARVFQKLNLNFTWWVNRKDLRGNNLFGGGFLGMDNVGVFDRSQPLPTGGFLEQADGTSWMAFYCATMLSMALELAQTNPEYEDLASKYFEHFVGIADAMNSFGGTGLWDETDGFYYDQLHASGRTIPLRVRSMVGLVPLFACEILEESALERLPEFRKRMNWFLENRRDLASSITYAEKGDRHRLLAVPSRERLKRMLCYMLDENEFFSSHGIRSVSRIHRDHPYVFRSGGLEWDVGYVPGESSSGAFGGNSNWRGPIWFPDNYLIIEALERYGHFYGESLKVECPTGSGNVLTLTEVARELSRRLASIFMPDADGRRPWCGGDRRFAEDPHWRDLVMFHEYFDGDTGRGLGANHQTGWTALVTRCFENLPIVQRQEASAINRS
jgi:Glycosyl hydrolase family 63 C-terminal domain